MGYVERNTADVDYEVLANHEKGDLYEIINKEFDRARGEYVVLTCDDCAVQPGWARKMLDSIRQLPDSTVGCFTTYEEKDGNLRKFEVKYYGEECSLFPCVRRVTVDALVGPFLSPYLHRFYGDIDLSLRYFSIGGRLEKVEDAKIFMKSNRDQIKKDAISKWWVLDDQEFRKRWGNDFNLRRNEKAACAV